MQLEIELFESNARYDIIEIAGTAEERLFDELGDVFAIVRRNDSGSSADSGRGYSSSSSASEMDLQSKLAALSSPL